MASGTVTLPITDLRLVEKGLRAVDRGKTVKIVVSGPQAAAGAGALNRAVPRPGAFLTGAEEIALAAVIIGGVLVAIGFGTVSAVCLYGIAKGYHVDAKYDSKKRSTVWDDSLTFKLVPPAPVN